MKYYRSYYNSPVGKLTLVASEKNLVAIWWEKEAPSRNPLPEAELKPEHSVLVTTQLQLEEYFSGQRTRFDLPLEMSGSPFQLAVWEALTKIPYGETRSYSDLAIQIGSPKASRAVGMANGKNRLSIVVPCHRVIGKSGALTGFAGGLNVKSQLLELESM